MYATDVARRRRVAYHDFDVAAQKSQEVEQALGGKAGKLPAQQARNFGLIRAQPPRRLRLRQPQRLDCLTDADRECGFGKPLFGIRQTEVGEYVSTAVLNRNFVFHFRNQFDAMPHLA